MELQRLRGRKNCDRVLRRGQRWRGKHMDIRWVSGAPRSEAKAQPRNQLYIGIGASLKLDKSAVRRNRMRRRCREALRLTAAEYHNLPTIQLLVRPRSSSLESPFEELLADASSFLSSL